MRYATPNAFPGFDISRKETPPSCQEEEIFPKYISYGILNGLTATGSEVSSHGWRYLLPSKDPPLM